MKRLMLVGLACLLAAPAFAQPTGFQDAKVKPELSTSLYLGTLFTLDQDSQGAIHSGEDLVTMRLVGSMAFPFGLRFAGRIDGTSLSAIDPNNLSLDSFRDIEGYAALSYGWKVAGLDVGPAAVVGAFIPIEDLADYRYEALYGAGGRIGLGRSYAYALLGSDGASDAACQCRGGTRWILSGQVEFKSFAAIADYVSGPGGRTRYGVLYRIPVFW